MKKRLYGLILALTLVISQAATSKVFASTDPGTFPPVRAQEQSQIIVLPASTDPGTFPPV